MIDILALDATDQIAALNARKISTRELLEASVKRTDQLHFQLNAVISRDLESAFKRAQQIDDRRAVKPWGALQGCL